MAITRKVLYGHPGDSSTQRATGAVAISTTVAPGVAWQLEEIRLHLDAAGGAGATNFTATLDHGTGATYDLLIVDKDLTTATDVIFQPDRPMEFLPDDELDIAWANAGTKTYGLEIVYKGI